MQFSKHWKIFSGFFQGLEKFDPDPFTRYFPCRVSTHDNRDGGFPMSRLLPLMCLVVALGVPASSQSASTGSPLRASLYGHVESFEWKEYNNDGSRILKESGPLAGIGGSLDLDTRKGFHVEGLGDAFFGRVDYDGATQAGDPVTTKTKYAGFLAEANLVVPLNIGPRFTVSPYGGAGGRVWRRELEDSGEALGYVEYWSTFYGTLGIRAAARIGSKAELFGKAAVKMPFYNRVNYDFSNLGGPDNVEVEPGKETGPYAELGLTIGDFMLAGFYEEMKFSKSNFADIGNDIIVWQPESKATIFGVRAGVNF
jgi:hypothetical protein